MRYRPWIIVYAAGLFLVTFGLGGAFLPRGHPETTNAHIVHHDRMESVMHYEVLPVTLVVLTALILSVTSRRTRSLLLRSIAQTRRELNLARYFSPNLADKLAEAVDARALSGRRSNAAVLFVDLRNFTTLGEAMAPEELTTFLSEYRTRLTDPPPLKWSGLRYGFDLEEDQECRGRDTSRRRLWRSYVRLMC